MQLLLDLPSIASLNVEWRDKAVDILLDVAESMMTAKGEQSALNRLASLALDATGADRCAILVRDPMGHPRLLPAAGSSRIGGDLGAEWRRFRDMEPIEVEGHPERLALWNAPRTVTVEDVASSNVLPEGWKRAWGSKSLAFTSLRAAGRIYGLLAVEYVTGPHRFSAPETRLLDAIASAAGVSLRNTRLLEQTRRSAEIERRLAECTAAVQSGRSLSEVLDLVVDRFTSLIPGTACSINLVEEDGTSFRVVAFRGTPPATQVISLSERPSQDIEIIRLTWERDPTQPIVIPDVQQYGGWRDVVPPNIGPGMLVPLYDGETVLGFVAAGRERRNFSKDEIRVAVAFAGQAGIAVSKARLHEALETRLREIETLTALNDVVLRTSNLRRILASLNKGVCKQMNMICSRIAFADQAVAALLGTRPLDEVEMQLLRTWRTSPSLQPMVLDRGIAAPIPMRGRPTGILWVKPLRDVEPAMLQFVTAVAGCLGEVASKAKLRRTAEVRSRELTVAAERERIARDLHDTVGQTFFGMGLKLEDLMADVADPEIRGRIAEIRGLASGAVADVRSAVYALSFLHVRATGLISSLRALTRQFSQATGIQAELRMNGRLPALSDETKSALFRVTHEALVNVDRHARATGVVVTLDCRQDEVELNIRDDGVGLDARQVADWRSSAHFGMRAMAKAAHNVGGTFKVTPAQPRGLAISAKIPLRVFGPKAPL